MTVTYLQITSKNYISSSKRDESYEHKNLKILASWIKQSL